MISKASPFLRATTSAFGTFGSSINPNRSVTRVKPSEIGEICTRSSGSVRGRIGGQIVRTTLCSCRTLLCLRLCKSEAGAKSGSLVRNTAVPGAMCGGFFSRLRISEFERHFDASRFVDEDARAALPSEDQQHHE